MVELKPCPFCGGEAKNFGKFSISYVKCRKCGAEICRMSESNELDFSSVRCDKRAIEAWNRRVDNETD